MHRLPALAATLLFVAACAGRQKSDNIPPPEPPTAEWVRDDKVIPLLSPEQSNPLAYETHAQPTFNKLAKKVQRCYKKELKARPRLHGELVIALTVPPSGVVEKAWISYSSVPSLSLEGCILPLFEGLQLPAPGGEAVEVHHPYVFTSRKTPPEIAQALQRLHKLEDPDNWAETWEGQQQADEFDAPW